MTGGVISIPGVLPLVGVLSAPDVTQKAFIKSFFESHGDLGAMFVFHTQTIPFRIKSTIKIISDYNDTVTEGITVFTEIVNGFKYFSVRLREEKIIDIKNDVVEGYFGKTDVAIVDRTRFEDSDVVFDKSSDPDPCEEFGLHRGV